MMQIPHRPQSLFIKKWLRNTLSLAASLLLTQTTDVLSAETPQVALTLAPSKTNPRNSEGDFITLKDGRISSDGGKTWSDTDKLEMENDGEENIMSVSLLRLQDSRIALFYCRKNSITDLRPIIRFSSDEGKSWFAATQIIKQNGIGYYVVNNDRLVQLADGRLIFPTAQHNSPSLKKFNGHGTIHCYISDDQAKTWHRAKTSLDGKKADGKQTMLQEPGLVELQDGRLMMWTRTNGGSQFVSYSKDRGETWTKFAPSSLLSPVSPASIERLPKTKELIAVWNDHSAIPKELRGKRTPLSIALSKDDGKTWLPAKTLYELPTGWYCYTAIEFTDSDILLGHCAGDTSKGGGLNVTKITRVPIPWLSAN